MKKLINLVLVASFLLLLIVPMSITVGAAGSGKVVLHSTSIDVSRATYGDTITVTVKADNIDWDRDDSFVVLEREPYRYHCTHMKQLKEIEEGVYKAEIKVDASIGTWKNGTYRLSAIKLFSLSGEEVHYLYGDAGMTNKEVVIYNCDSDVDAPVIKSITGTDQTVYDGDTFSFDFEIEEAGELTRKSVNVITYKADGSDSSKSGTITNTQGNHYKVEFSVDSSWERGEYILGNFLFTDGNGYDSYGRVKNNNGTITREGYPEGFSEITITVADKKTDGDQDTPKPTEPPTPSESVKPSESPAPSETVKPSESPKPVEPVTTTKYNDVPVSGTWYSDAVYYATEKGYMAGTGNNKFTPTGTVTRGTIAQILYAAEGKPEVSGKSQFTDVGDAKWYAKAVKWAADKGLVSGYGNGKFGPENAVTREQMLAIMYKYSEMKGYVLSASADLSKFADQKDISKYAVNAMKWGVSHNVISGTNKGIEPKGNATRAQIAVILQAYDKNVRK